jgi:hypothetical protein
MTVSLRLSKTQAEFLGRAAKQAGVSKSEYLRQCLDEKMRGDRLPTLYDLGKDLFGKHSSGRTDLAVNAEQIVREKIHAKARRDPQRADRRAV